VPIKNATGNVKMNATATLTLGKSRLSSIQALRGVAVTLVVFGHFATDIREYHKAASWIVQSGLSTLGASGVDLFFVISGFIMVYTTTGKSGPGDALSFLKKRFLRIFPLYWVWTSLLLCLWSAGLALKNEKATATFIVNSYLLIPTFNGRNFHPFLDQGWTLSFEIFFYLIFSVAILARIQRLKPLFIAAAFIFSAILAHATLPKGGAGRYLLSNSILYEFLFGVIAARIAASARVKDSWIGKPATTASLIGVGCTCFLICTFVNLDEANRVFIFGLPSLMIVTGLALRDPDFSEAKITYLGDASYSIYLTHGFFTLAYGAMLKHPGILQQLSPDASLVTATALTVGITALTYRLVEKPLTALLRPRNQALALRKAAA
jgi:peptidoglycan/LPS O-acetylase OafA/YrhL